MWMRLQKEHDEESGIPDDTFQSTEPHQEELAHSSEEMRVADGVPVADGQKTIPVHLLRNPQKALVHRQR